MKAICSFSIDPTVVTIFKARYPKLASSMVERYMRDALDLDANDSVSDDIDSVIEKTRRDLELKKIELRALETKQINKDRLIKEQKEQDAKTQEQKEQEEIDARKSIKDYDWEFEYNYRAAKQKMTAVEFLKTKLGAKNEPN